MRPSRVSKSANRVTASSGARERLASAKQYVLYGDQWQIDARVVRWKLPALMAGVPPLYRLERLSGRYGDAARKLPPRARSTR